MSTIGTATSNTSDILNLLLAGSTASSAGDTLAPIAAATAGPETSRDRDPATRLDLSDKVKDILARARTDRSAADRLQAFVEQHREGASSQETQSNSARQTGGESKIDLDEAFRNLTGQNENSLPDTGLDPTNGFFNRLNAAGTFASLDSQTGSSTVIVNGSGWSYADFKTGSLEEIVRASVKTGEYDVTYTRTDAAAASVTSSSDAGIVSASAAEVHRISVTFATNFNTGAFSITQSETTALSANVQIGSPGSNFSTLA